MSETSDTPADLGHTDADGDSAQPPEIRLNTVSTVEAAADAVRELILDGGLEPGARLKETPFAERLGIARHTFRAAAQILIGEGLLRRSPNRGLQLAILDAADINDIFKLRAALELEAVRLVILQEKPLEGAARAAEQLNSLQADAPWRDVVDPDMAFHRAIIDATGSERLARSFATVQSEILLCMAQLRPHYDHPSQVAAEHRGLLEPLLNQQLELADQRFREHLNEAAANLTEALKAQKETIA
ncbi:MAG: GntR family transcriptional regulator [Solirubrobacterales bacterium]